MPIIMDNQSTTPAPSAVTGISFVSVYVADYQPAYVFYADLLGLEKQYDMGGNACFFKLGGEWGLYLEGGNTAQETTPKSARSSFTLSVPSAGALFGKLRAAGVKMVQTEPMDMSQGDFWFQFHDPAGNIIEALGGK